MKRALYILIIVCLILLAFTSCTSLNHDKNGGDTPQSSETGGNSKYDVATGKIDHKRFTYIDAKEKFPYDENNETYSEYKDRVFHETEKLKEEIDQVHREIINQLHAKYQDLANNDVQPLMEENEFNTKYIESYENYYNILMSTAEASTKAYSSLSEMECYPANSAGENSALWSYVVYYNILDELTEILKWIS